QLHSYSYGDNHQGRVILQSFSSERSDGLQYRLLKFSCGRTAILQQQLDEALFTEVLAFTVGCFRDSVSNQNQAVARRNGDFGFIVLDVGKYTQHHTTVGQ